jgi:hypothetical protein
VVAELQRLYDGDAGIMPTKAKANAFKDVKLKPEQMHELNGIAGKAMRTAYEETLKKPEYQAMSDDDKRKALLKVNDTVFGALKTQYGVDKGLMKAEDAKLDTKQTRYLKNGTLASLTGSDKQTYREKYDSAVKNYETDKSTLSVVERAKKEKEIDKLKVQKDFDNDTVDLYGMSKADVYDLVSKDDHGQELVDKAVAYGDALVDAGLRRPINSVINKGRVAIRPKSKGGKKGGKKGSGGGSGSKLKPSDFKTAI